MPSPSLLVSDVFSLRGISMKVLRYPNHLPMECPRRRLRGVLRGAIAICPLRGRWALRNLIFQSLSSNQCREASPILAKVVSAKESLRVLRFYSLRALASSPSNTQLFSKKRQ